MNTGTVKTRIHRDAPSPRRPSAEASRSDADTRRLAWAASFGMGCDPGAWRRAARRGARR